MTQQDGEKKRQIAAIESEAERLRGKARRRLGAIAQECLAKQSDHCDCEAVEKTLGDVVPDFFERELGEMFRGLSRGVAEALHPHHQRVCDLAEAVRQVASGIFEIAHTERQGAAGLEMTRWPLTS
ncbi:hypothetical protein FJY63_04790 [Candidatus Sumerlaeota bacterium]|nr:hypothetical protein [Candidatus Sumerlaeota bacterium]